MENRKHVSKRIFGCIFALLTILIIGLSTEIKDYVSFTAKAISYPAYFEVIEDQAAVREGPGSEYKIKGRVSVGKRLKAYGSAKSKEGNTFYKIKNSKGENRYIYHGRVAYRGSINTGFNKRMVVVNCGEELMFWNNPYTDKLSKYTSRVYPGYGYGSTFIASYKIERDNVVWYKVKDQNVFVHSKHVKKHTSCTWKSGTITKAATCTSKGTKTYRCTLCSATKTSTVAALGHTFGSGSGWCSRCGYWNVKSSSSLNNEKYVVITNNAAVHNGPYRACTTVATLPKNTVIYVTQKVKNGQDNIWYKYSGGYIFEDHVKKHTSCTWKSGTITKAATCTSKGTKTYRCTLCSATKTSTVAALGHTFGSGSGWCSRCGYWNVKSSSSLNNEKYVVITNNAAVHNGPYRACTTVATLPKNTVIYVTQKVKNGQDNIWYKYSGGYIFEDHVKKHTSCTWNSGTITKAATCTTTGIKEYTCTLCRAKKSSNTAALGHKYKNGKCIRCSAWTVKSASAVNNVRYVVISNGVKVHNGPYGSCATVATLSKKTIIYVTQKVKNGEGNTWYRYSGGYIFEDHVKKHTSCTWNSGKATKAATCTTTGIKEYTCTLCGAKKTATIAKDSSKHKWNKYVCAYCQAWDSKSLKSKKTLNNVKYRVEVESAPTYAGPYSTAKSKGNIGIGKTVTAVLEVKNAYGNTWYKLSDNRYIFRGNVKKYISNNYKGLKISANNVETYVGSTVIIKASTEKGYFPTGVSISASDPKMLTVSQEIFPQKKDLLVSNYEFAVKVNNMGKNSGHGKVYVSYIFDGQKYTKTCTITARSNNIVLAEGTTYTPIFKQDGKAVSGMTYSSSYNKKNVSYSGGNIKAVHTGVVTVNYRNALLSGSLKVTVVTKFESKLIRNNTTYQHDLARFCADFCYLGYGVSNSTMKNRLKMAGFDVSNISVNMNAERDEVNYFIVKKSLGKKTLVFIAAIGSYKNQWYSNFDPYGRSDERKSKYAMDESVHAGFNDAKEYVYSKLTKYLSDNRLKHNNTVFLITGHSRGAAIANLLAAKLIDDSSYPNSNIFAYTFATPNVAKGKAFTNKVYNCIFNILNPEDFVTHVMLEKWGYSRYGKSYVLPSSTNCNNYSTYKKKVNEFHKKYYHSQGSDYDPYPQGEKATYTIIKKMGQSFPTAASLYEEGKYNYTYAAVHTPEGFTIWMSDKLSGYEMFKKTILPVVAEDNKNTSLFYILGGAINDGGIYGDILRYFIKVDADVQDFTDMDISKLKGILGGRFKKAHSMETYCSFMYATSSEEIKVENRKSEYDWSKLKN